MPLLRILSAFSLARIGLLPLEFVQVFESWGDDGRGRTRRSSRRGTGDGGTARRRARRRWAGRRCPVRSARTRARGSGRGRGGSGVGKLAVGAGADRRLD